MPFWNVGTNTDHLRQIILAIPVLIAALAGLIALPVTLIRQHYTRRQTLAEEEGLITDRMVAMRGAEKTVKLEALGKNCGATGQHRSWIGRIFAKQLMLRARCKY